MNRRHLLGSIGTLGIGAVVGFAAQDDDERISDLEDEVADLDDRVSALEENADSDNNSEGDPEDEESPKSGNDGDWPTVEGSGTAVSEKFELEEGTYRVHATLQIEGDFSGFIVMIYDPSGNEHYTFNELIQASGEWTGELVFQAPESGEYYVEVSNTTSAWKLEFEPY